MSIAVTFGECPSCSARIPVDRWSQFRDGNDTNRVEMMALQCKRCGLFYCDVYHWPALCFLPNAQQAGGDTTEAGR